MKRLFLLTLFSLALALCIFFFKKRNPTTLAAGQGLVIKKEWLDTNHISLTPPVDRRPADQTFLTFPEWYLVFSPAEQAHYFKHTTASTFPFMSHTAQIWQSYRIVNDQIKGNFPVNKGYHFMIWVIGTSASAEYSVKAWYETLAGRLTDTHEVLTEEDRFNAKFTQDYVDFIKDRPWYEFDFKSRFNELWSTSFFGEHFLRKWERKYILTSELAVKYVYGKLIGMGTQSMYGAALPTTAVVLDSLPLGSELKAAKIFDNKNALVYLPRYDRFNDAACRLARQGGTFKEIAGNAGALLVSVLVPAKGPIRFNDALTVFVQPLASDPALKRVAVALPVCKLHHLLHTLEEQALSPEHIFDF